jgi:hypothetical protein
VRDELLEADARIAMHRLDVERVILEDRRRSTGCPIAAVSLARIRRSSPSSSTGPRCPASPAATPPSLHASALIAVIAFV